MPRLHVEPVLCGGDLDADSPDNTVRFCAARQAYFAKWGDEGVVDLQEKLSELVILTASRTLLGAATTQITASMRYLLCVPWLGWHMVAVH